MMFRPATLDEISLILDWAAAEGWNPGLDDAAAFHATDPQGVFVAEAKGAPVAAISVVNHSDQFAFLGLYLCRPEWRGKGIAFQLWNHALQHAENRTVGLDGVAEQQANYARSGFALHGASLRLAGSLPRMQTSQTRTFTASDLPAIEGLDRRANGYERPSFLKAWTEPSATRRTVVLDGDDGILGFATARLCRDGCKIGPIVSNTVDEAIDLAASAAGLLEAETAIVDVPGKGIDLHTRLVTLGFAEVFATARMYRGPAPERGSALQAIATMELG